MNFIAVKTSSHTRSWLQDAMFITPTLFWPSSLP